VVYVVDSGIDLTHSDFYLPGYANTTFGEEDREGHGTLVAGLIAGAFTGMAPYARIQSMKLKPDFALENVSQVLSALQALETTLDGTRRTPVILVLSAKLTSRVPYSIWKQLTPRYQRLFELGCFVIVPRGSGFEGTCSEIPSPHILVVGAIDANNTIVPGSAGNCVHVYAPGAAVLTTKHNGGYAEVSGAEYAAAHVAGVTAAYLSAGLGFANTREAVWNRATRNQIHGLGQLRAYQNRIVYLSPFGKLGPANPTRVEQDRKDNLTFWFQEEAQRLGPTLVNDSFEPVHFSPGTHRVTQRELNASSTLHLPRAAGKNVSTLLNDFFFLNFTRFADLTRALRIHLKKMSDSPICATQFDPLWWQCEPSMCCFLVSKAIYFMNTPVESELPEVYHPITQWQDFSSNRSAWSPINFPFHLLPTPQARAQIQAAVGNRSGLVPQARVVTVNKKSALDPMHSILHANLDAIVQFQARNRTHSVLVFPVLSEGMALEWKVYFRFLARRLEAKGNILVFPATNNLTNTCASEIFPSEIGIRVGAVDAHDQVIAGTGPCVQVFALGTWKSDTQESVTGAFRSETRLAAARIAGVAAAYLSAGRSVKETRAALLHGSTPWRIKGIMEGSRNRMGYLTPTGAMPYLFTKGGMYSSNASEILSAVSDGPRLPHFPPIKVHREPINQTELLLAPSLIRNVTHFAQLRVTQRLVNWNKKTFHVPRYAGNGIRTCSI
jgi:hypothetical protein